MFKPNWLRLPGGIAMALGLGALSTAGARTDLAEAHQRASLGDGMIRSEGERSSSRKAAGKPNCG